MNSSDYKYDFIVVGNGVAGMSAGLYAGRYNLNTLIAGHEFGGETAKAGMICNYPGAREIDGFDLVSTMKMQAEDGGAKFLDEEIRSAVKKGDEFELEIGKEKYFAKTILLAVGSKRARLGLPNEAELTGKGVHYCVTCDGPVYAGKTVAMVGGGDAAVKGANLLAEYVDKIYLITRDVNLTAETASVEKMQSHGDKIIRVAGNSVSEIVGKSSLEKLVLKNEFMGSRELAVSGLFVEIGSSPNSDLAKSLGVELDERGYIKVNNEMKTNIAGVLAAGDSTNFFGRFKQCITAAAMGAVAGATAYEICKQNT
jgi:thioredoxin reductase (NADPH)